MARNTVHLEAFNKFAEPFIHTHGRFEGRRVAGEKWRAMKDGGSPAMRRRNPNINLKTIGLAVGGVLVLTKVVLPALQPRGGTALPLKSTANAPYSPYPRWQSD